MTSPVLGERLCADLPAVGGVFRASADDFRVVELPAYEPVGDGDHLYLRIRKTGLSTDEAARRIARALGRRPRDVGYAGRKDRHAVTEQTLSIEHVEPAAAESALAGLEGIELLAAARHRNKLRLGHLRGNRFELVLREVGPDAPERAEAVLRRLAERGVPNAFGAQRFGRELDNHLVGRELVRGDLAAAAERLAAGQGRAAERIRGDLERGVKPGRVLRHLPRSLPRLLVSAYQSALFNRMLARRLQELDALRLGDLAYLHDRGAVFEVLEPEVEAPRAAAFEVSPTGPMYGSTMSWPTHEVGELERELLAAEGLTPEDFRRTPGGSFRGERRPLRIPLTEPHVETAGDALRVAFALPRGSYATAVLAELGASAPTE